MRKVGIMTALWYIGGVLAVAAAVFYITVFVRALAS